MDSHGSGVAICPIDHPLISLDSPGCWKFSLDFVPKKPIVFLNLYNNQWNTNFRYWYPGTWSSRVRIWTFDAGTAPDAIIAKPAIEARNPLLAVSIEGNGKILPSKQSGLTLSRKGVLVTALCANPDGNPGILLRLWEQAGEKGKLEVKLPGNFKTAIPVNLRGEKIGDPVKIWRNKLNFELNAYAPASFILQ